MELIGKKDQSISVLGTCHEGICLFMCYQD